MRRDPAAPALTDTSWTVRVRTTAAGTCQASGTAGSFAIGPALRFDPSPPTGPPSALEAFLGALGADLLEGTRKAAARRRLQLEDAEISISCRLVNPLVALGVIGETGDPGIESITATLYASGDFLEPEMVIAWSEARERSSIARTLARALPIEHRLAVVS